MAYGASLFMWDCRSNAKGIPEPGRAPTTQAVISAFIAHLVSAYFRQDNLWLLKWCVGLADTTQPVFNEVVDTVLWVAEKLMPNTSRRKKWSPTQPSSQ